MDIIFMGTPDFAVPVLETLTASEKHTVKAVVTQPDKARGRSGKLIFTPVKEVAVKHGIPVYTPQKVKDPEFVETLKQISCDIIVVVAFGQILSKEILDFPKYGCVNVHASLLPRWRGAAPIQWSILNRVSDGYAEAVTTQNLYFRFDQGAISVIITVYRVRLCKAERWQTTVCKVFIVYIDLIRFALLNGIESDGCIIRNIAVQLMLHIPFLYLHL